MPPDSQPPSVVIDPLEPFDTRNPRIVESLFLEASEANHDALCRAGSIDLLPARGTLLATGDLHDNPLHFARVLQLARLDAATPERPRHVTLHEVIHGASAMGIDFSHRALLRVAALKRAYPECVHTLLANHELSQIVGAGILKDGVRVVDAFNAGVEHVYAEEAPRVLLAIESFIRSMPIALVSRTEDGLGVLCAHSLPSPAMMSRFDPDVLERGLMETDYEPRAGAAHLIVWGRGHTPEQLDSLARRWNVSLFILGHQHAETGWTFLPPNTIVLSSDHTRGVALPIDLASPPAALEAVLDIEPLANTFV